MSRLQRGAVPDRCRARGPRRPRAAHRCRYVALGRRGAQRGLGRRTAQVPGRLRREELRPARSRARLLRGAARAPLRLPLEGPVRLPLLRLAAPAERLRRRDRHRRWAPRPSSSSRSTAPACRPPTPDDRKPVPGTVRVGGDGALARRHGWTLRRHDRPRHLPPRGTCRLPGRPSRPASNSTCRCASTPTISRPTSPGSRPARSPTSRSSRSAHEALPPGPAGAAFRRDDALPTAGA